MLLSTVNTKQLIDMILLAYRCLRPIMIWGGPGIGKSDCVRQAADSANLDLRDIRVSQLDPVDLRGLPSVKDGQTWWNPPAFLPEDGKGILFLDEINAAPPMVQAALYQLLLDRRLGEYSLPDGWVVIGAGNRESDGGVTFRMPTPVRSRFLSHVTLEADEKHWVEWAVRHGIRPEVVAHIRFRPETLYQFSKDGSFPCPRTWAFASQIIDQQPPTDILRAMLAGCLGDGAATELSAYLELIGRLPDLDDVIKDPKRYINSIPKHEPGLMYALASGMARKITVRNAASAMEYVNAMPEEYQVVTVSDALVMTDALKGTRAMLEWVTKHADVFTITR